MSLHVAMVSDHASPLASLGGADAGGQNVYVGNVARGLAELGHTVDVFTRRDDPAVPEVAPWVDGVRLIHVPAGPATAVPKEELLPYMDAFADYVTAFCAVPGARRYDLLHANFFMSGVVAERMRVTYGTPYVMTFHALGRVRRRHQGEQDRFPPAREEIEALVVEHAARIICECPNEQRELVELYGADPARLELVPAGYDPAELWPIGRELARARLGLDPARPVVLHVGRMVPRKGVDDVVRGFAHARALGVEDDPQLLIAGGSTREPDVVGHPELARLHGIARDAGVGDAVTFLGARRRDELLCCYGAADVFVTTPWYEPFGITPLEAMATATPVIGSNVGGIGWTVQDQVTGVLVPPRDPAAVGLAMHRLLAEPELRERLGRNGLRRAQARFTWGSVVDRLDDVYRDVVEGAATGRHARFGVRGVPAIIDRELAASARATRSLCLLQRPIEQAALLLVDRLREGARVLVFGNGGSAADAQHLAAELVGRYERDGRPPLSALALTTDGAVLTAWSNDTCFADVFARQVLAHGRPGDVAIGITTSGRSANVVEGLRAARDAGLATIVLTGGTGGDAVELADVAIVAASARTPRVQELHGMVVHALCAVVDEQVAVAGARQTRRRTT